MNQSFKVNKINWGRQGKAVCYDVFKRLAVVKVINHSDLLNNYIILVEGHCSGISSGQHQISLYKGPCELGSHLLYGYTGWQGHVNRIIVEEFRVSSNIIGGKERLC